MKASRLASALAAASLGLVSLTALADVPAPQDVPYQGTLKVSVDATDLAHRIFRVHEVIPAQPGALTLLYPQWLPGNHSPSGPIDKLAGLVVTANGKTLTWKRDTLNVYAFHVDVPDGASSVEVSFQFLSPQNMRQGRVVMTPEMLNLQWNANTLYPAGYFSKRIMAETSVTFPAGWQFGTALEVASRDGDTVHFKPIAYNDLVDSPIYAGKYFKRIDLDPGAKTPVHLNIVADAAKYLEITPEQIKVHQNLVQQMYKMYGAHHYNHYDFLLSLSDKMSGNGLEHHRSSENGVGTGYFTEWKKNALRRDLLAHEFNHSWDGKYRRGADLTTPNFNVPMQDSLLWVYEGQTQFWGYVMAARSGLWKEDQARDMLAYVAATYDKGRPGLASWRNVQDTTNDPIIAQRAPLPYRNYQSSEDYYSAGQMIWLDVDAKLRDLSKGKHSIDDFGKAFFGMDSGQWAVNTYTFEDVVKTLNTLQPFDWSSFLRTRLDGHGSLIGGIEGHGWKLEYTDKPSDAAKAMEAMRHSADLTYSLGLSVGKDGSIGDVLWDGPAFKAGIAPSMTVVAVNGRDYDADALKDAVTASATDKSLPIELLVKNFDQYQTIRLDYHDGLKYPHLVRDTSKPDTLSTLLKAR
ncbi:M61 family peptidase [Rhodanobacter sp. AS-Z3]|uniref:M61 family metallopeptidase n=1 Tax=Rhodanobacter sp. AS-Z3 TaxID=3031330 RepID=UPI00247B0348|nr:M61 family peptidase [Rhodanobacter sp. AS-Z3]WEN15805.1 M61 family peptidase [Rhodanobacter sp. AS-Z3]